MINNVDLIHVVQCKWFKHSYLNTIQYYKVITINHMATSVKLFLKTHQVQTGKNRAERMDTNCMSAKCDDCDSLT